MDCIVDMKCSLSQRTIHEWNALSTGDEEQYIIRRSRFNIGTMDSR